MQDRPTAAELLEAIADLLEQQVLPATDGPLRHQVRVAGNLCRILEREARLGGPQEEREIALLREVIAEPTGADDAASLTEQLARALAEDEDPELEARAWPALLEIVRGKLAVAKPAHDAWTFEGEIPE